MMLVIGLVAAFVTLRYFSWRSRITAQAYEPGNSGPRLIVHAGLQLALAVSTAIGICLVLVIGSVQFVGMTYTDLWLGRMLAEINKYAIVLLVPLCGTMALLLPKLRPAFDIVLDVVNHFYFRPTNVQDALNDDDEFDISETTFESGSLFFSRRDAIQSRLKRILIHFRDRLNHRTELVVVCHSQGTMISIETLNDPDLDWLHTSFSTISLVTLGSPFKHVYQHYFQHIYPELTHQRWSRLRRTIDRWINVFRIDDYVGREIDFPKFHQTSAFERMAGQPDIIYTNHQVGPRGHQSYWADREVLNIVRDQVFGREDECQQKAA